MRKFLLVLIMLGVVPIICDGAWDNTTNLQTLSPAAAFQKVQDNFSLIGGTPAGGIVLPSGAVFYMITGSCPAGSTDVTATYSNKFIKINATQGTSSGVVLTGTTDSHTLTIAEMPAHTHTIDKQNNYAPGSIRTMAGSNASDGSLTSDSTGGDGGHTHTLSTATTLEPSSVTCKLCQVN